MNSRKQGPEIEFFEKIRKNKLPQLEIINQVQYFTGGFDLKNLKTLREDFNDYLNDEKKSISDHYIDGEKILDKIEELEKNNQPIPFLEEGDRRLTPFRHEVPQLSDKYIDIEKLFFQDAFFYCYKFQDILDEKIASVENEYSSKKGSRLKRSLYKENISIAYKLRNGNISEESFIYSNNGDDRNINLSQFQDKLLDPEKPFIRKPRDIRQFRNIFSGKKITKPIIWLGTNYELYYLITLLIKKDKIEKGNKHFAIAVKCFKDKDNNKINYDSLRTARRLPPKQRKKLIEDMVDLL